jgi:aminomuconate-semialdehyde/2-hydroxymuconate-6-semialdehyde dehydrogenase
VKQFMNFIDGQFVHGHGPAVPDYFPATGRVIGEFRAADQVQVDAAVGAARRALKGPWGKMSIAERVGLLRKLADGINARFDDFLAAEVMDTGKPCSIASHLDIPRGAANFNVFADQIMTTGTESFQTATPDGAGALNYTIRVPKGVIAVVCPWNLPLLLMTWKVAPALACGNVVVVKPSEETPATATLLGEVMNGVGIPPGVYNVVHGLGPDSAGEFLVNHPDVDAITFTGETRTGEAIMAAAARGVRPVSLELGGKNAAVVFDDADVTKTIEGLGRSCFSNTGQICLGTERVYVQRGIFDRVVEGLVAKANSYKFGDPFDHATSMGPVISKEHQSKVLSFFDRAISDGATALAGGGIPKMQGYEGGYWVEPTVWIGLREDSTVATDEIFGPCAYLTPFDDEDEVVSRVNNNAYGLATSIWTDSLARAHRTGARIDVGIVWVNSWFLRDLRTPFGGMKRSGIGREGGAHSLEFYTELRNICVKL